VREQIGIHVDHEFRASVDRRQAERTIRQILRDEGVTSPYEVSLVVTDSETVQRLNRDYRGIDEPTDVLAFHMLPQKGSDSSFTLPPDGVIRLGEVVVSYPQAAAQAKEQRHSPEEELALLVIHGILHLMGYDHEGPEEEHKMRKREKELLERYLLRNDII
jgi:probable rRNA maturation factor